MNPWSTNALLRFRPDKCYSINICNKLKQYCLHNYKMNNKDLENKSKIKDLRIIGGVVFYSLVVTRCKSTPCSLLFVKSLVTRYKIRSLLVANSLIIRCRIRSLLVVEVACCNKSLVTRCKIRSLLITGIARSKKLLVVFLS